jgi:hypothetical protein
MERETFSRLEEEIDYYAYNSREKTIAKAIRRGMYSGILIGFIAGMTVAIYMMLYAWRI